MLPQPAEIARRQVQQDVGTHEFHVSGLQEQEQAPALLGLVASITAEGLGHVELVSNGVAILNNGPDKGTDGADGGGTLPVNSDSMAWNADMVTTTGNMAFDLPHNFHLECGARLHKLRVYETLFDPTGCEVCGYLLVRGSVHAQSYALALKNLTGVEMR